MRFNGFKIKYDFNYKSPDAARETARLRDNELHILQLKNAMTPLRDAFAQLKQFECAAYDEVKCAIALVKSSIKNLRSKRKVIQSNVASKCVKVSLIPKELESKFDSLTYDDQLQFCGYELSRSFELGCGLIENLALRKDAAKSIKSWATGLVKTARESRITPSSKIKYTRNGSIEYKVIGSCFVESNSILGMIKRIKASRVRSNKRPATKQNHVGVEIECMIDASNPIDAFYDALCKAGLDSKVCVKDDGSIRPDEGMRGLELTVCDNESDIYSTIETACKVLTQFDVSVNKTCGLHVHLDARNRKVSVMGQRLIAAQPLLFSIVPKSRRTNDYCLPTHFDQSIDEPGERYKAVNLNAYNEHSTIEIRLHSGSYDPCKINNWIRILLKIVEIEIPGETPPNAMAWCDLLGVSPELRDFIRERALRFNEAIPGKDDVKIPLRVEFFKNVHFDDHASNSNDCDVCECNLDDCECSTCERCDERTHSDNACYDDANGETYCDGCMNEINDAREIASNSRRSRR